MDDLPIIELPEHYFIDDKRLGMAIAHVSAQTNSIAEHQAELRRRQSLYEEEQQRFIEQRVSAAREEAEARNNALVLAIKQTYGDPSTLELRVDARIQDILQQLQHGAQEQARAFAEAHVANQAALNQLVEQRMHAALQHIEQEVIMQTEKCIRDLRQEIYKVVEDRFLNAVQRAEENARVVVRGELRDQGCARQESFARSEARVVQLVKGIIEQNDSVTRKRQERETEAFTDRIEERLRQVVVVAKSAAETKAREVVALQMNAPKATVTSAVTPTELARPVADTSKDATASAKFRAKPRRGQERKTRAQIDDDRHNESVSTLHRQERRTRAKMDRIRQDAQEAVRARAATRAAELLEPKPKVRVKS